MFFSALASKWHRHIYFSILNNSDNYVSNRHWSRTFLASYPFDCSEDYMAEELTHRARAYTMSIEGWCGVAWGWARMSGRRGWCRREGQAAAWCSPVAPRDGLSERSVKNPYLGSLEHGWEYKDKESCTPLRIKVGLGGFYEQIIFRKRGSVRAIF